METLLVALDLADTFVFALSGALVGVRHRLDLFGVVVLAFAAATAGGILRDLIIGAVPPPAIADPRYFVVPVVAGLLTFFWHPVVTRLQASVLVLDGAGWRCSPSPVPSRRSSSGSGRWRRCFSVG